MTCTHHYILETPSGPTTSGRCKLCGHERHDFRSWYDEDTGETWKQQAKARKGREISLPSRKREDTYLRNPQSPEESAALLAQEREWAQRATSGSPRHEKAKAGTRVGRKATLPRYTHCAGCGDPKDSASKRRRALCFTCAQRQRRKAS